MARILIIDDYQPVRELYSNLLRKRRYMVDTAADGERGLEKMLRGGYDLILLDLVLPKLSGLEILEKYRNLKPKRSNKKIVVLATLGEENLIAKALEVGANSAILKSTINPEETVAEIEKKLD